VRYRIAELLAPEDLGPSGTKTVDITTRDPISRIEINFSATNGADGMSDHPAANITRVEVVDGSDLLFSMTGKCAQAMDYYDRLKPVGNYISRVNGDPNRCVIGINFGRYLWDPVLALDPTKFKAPQIKISWDEDVANTSATENECRVHAYLFDEFKPSLKGFLMSKEFYAYAPSADAYEHIDLPTDYVMRKMLVQALRKEQDLGGLVSEFRLSEDNDKRIPWDTTWLEEFYRHKITYGLYEEMIHTRAPATAAKIYVTPAIAQTVYGSLDTPDLVFTGWSLDGGVVSIEAETAEHEARIGVSGWMPHGCICFPFGKQDLLEDWYDVTRLGSLRLRVKAGSSAASTDTFRVITQQYRPA